MVVWAYGRTEGLRWEIAKLVRDVPPEKLIIALPFWKVPEKKRVALWQGVVEDIGHVFPRPLPAEIGSALFIQFSEDWTATPVLPKPPPLLVRTAAIGGWNRITDSIHALMESRGAPPRRRGFGEYVLYSALTSGWLLIGGFLFLMLYYLLVRPFVEIGLIESFVRAVF